LRRTALLIALVALGAVLVTLVRPPERPPPPGERGHRILRVSRADVRGIDVTLGERHFAAQPMAGGWSIDGRPAGKLATDALDDLARMLTTLRAVDVFRHAEPSHFGLDAPTGVITLATPRGPRRLSLGAHNSAASALYARRDDDPRIMQVGILLLSSLDRVFYARDHPSRAP
jgi:Domain of unknown function (DUF4340)